MNYLIDADVTFIDNEDINRKYYEWLSKWSKSNRYYLISKRNFDDLYAAIGKDLVYNAQAVYANSGRTVYIQGRLVEHDDALSQDPSRITAILEDPLTYYGDNIDFGHAVTAIGESFCRVRNWKEGWKHLKEEELCA